MPDTELLTDQQIAEIADMFPHAEYQPTLSPDEVDLCEFCKGTIDDHKANCVVPHVHALIATVKQLGRDNEALETQCKGLRGQSAELRNRISERNDRIVDLQSQLEQLRAENERLRESLATEVAKRVNVNVERMEQSREVSQSKLERTFDDRLSDTQRGSYD